MKQSSNSKQVISIALVMVVLLCGTIFNNLENNTTIDEEGINIDGDTSVVLAEEGVNQEIGDNPTVGDIVFTVLVVVVILIVLSLVADMGQN